MIAEVEFSAEAFMTALEQRDDVVGTDSKSLQTSSMLTRDGILLTSMSLLVDTSVWSIAFRRDVRSSAPEVAALRAAIDGGEAIVWNRSDT